MSAITGPAFETHTVTNQAPPLADLDLFATNRPLVEALEREGGGWAAGRAAAVGRAWGSAEAMAWGFEANAHPPRLHTHDRFGHRADRVEFHPAWHALMALSGEHELHSLPWTAGAPGAHAARAALYATATQVEQGFACPTTMTCAAIPALRREPALAAEWEPLLLAARYDGRELPAAEKGTARCGMGMTEKQGGSDVRATTTRAVPAGADGEHRLVGHKWFTSAPMCDAFLVLAQADEGLGCFLLPRILPDGSRNPVRLQRLKDKLGNRSNASSELEFHDASAWPVGEPGRGVATILEMVGHTRLDCVIGSSAIIRWAVAQAVWHAAHRRAFGRKLAEQPLMGNVLADLALESEAATTLMMRVARAYDDAERDPAAVPLRRLMTAVAKFWVCKRASAVTGEAMEVLGGNGYVEESGLPRLHREAPLNSIWEGAGNVVALDVLRTLVREPASGPALLDELDLAAGADRRLDAFVAALREELLGPDEREHRARRLVERMALALQAGLLVRHAPPAVADAFCAARLTPDGGLGLGTLPAGVATAAIVARALPA